MSKLAVISAKIPDEVYKELALRIPEGERSNFIREAIVEKLEKTPRPDKIFELEQKNLIKGTYFVYAGKKTEPYNPSYGLNDKIPWCTGVVPLRTAIKEIVRNGFEVGLHASTSSAVNQRDLSEEVHKLRIFSSQRGPVGVRHHRLVFHKKLTAEIQSSLGLKYDSTIGPNKKPGFVSGTAYPFYLYSENNGNVSPSIIEIPVTVQDFHLIENLRTHKNEDVIENILKLLEHGEGGVVNQIWHPERFIRKKCGKELFDKFSSFITVSAGNHWIASLSQIVDCWKKKEERLFE